jgi:hypothetical protein
VSFDNFAKRFAKRFERNKWRRSRQVARRRVVPGQPFTAPDINPWT